MIAAAGMERFVRIKTASNLWFLGDRPRPIWFVLEGPPLGPKSPLRRVGFPWILSSESSLINGLHGNFVGIFFVAVCHRRGRLAVGRLEVVDQAVDLVEQTGPFLRPVGMFRHDRVLG